MRTVDVPSQPPPRRDSSAPSSIGHGRFFPGTVVADRYRIIAMLGKGGMGEVYRADDLKLGQPVALKFLPREVQQNPDRLARFHTEVRLARQISHPNVCRVYDIGGVDGEHFLTMEYVEGDDLARLIYRIGRLQKDKAIQISRQICAGLAAAHEKGMLHRDLKPSNIMLDERGVVRITDFGLAGLIRELQAENVREGTPAYMAPEQLAGREVSVRSDIYSLGLILYEIFTGAQAFQASTIGELIRVREQTTPRSPASLVDDLNPAVERVILRCLENDPNRRPASAVAVAVALPGGDPLAAAVAAGETPSPDLVAAAGEGIGLRPAIALACLAAFVLGAALLFIFGKGDHLIQRTPMDVSPEALAGRARQVLADLGYSERPADNAFGIGYASDYIRYVRDHDLSKNRWSALAENRPPAILFWYRQSPRYFEPSNFFNLGSVTRSDPPPLASGMASVVLDGQGRLVEFQVTPPQLEDSASATKEPDWSGLFKQAQLDMTTFKTVEPKWIPVSWSEIRRAWQGSYGKYDLRVEAGSYKGKPIYFKIVGPWTRPERMQPFSQTKGQKANQVIGLTLFLTVLVSAIVVARRNLRLGRGDRRGATRLSLLVFTTVMLAWAFGSNHVPVPYELALFIMALSWGLFIAAMLWLLYLALEPYVRRKWPHTIVSWSRALAGQLRDPLVGRDILFGSVFGVAYPLLPLLQRFLTTWRGIPPLTPAMSNLQPFLGPRQLAGYFFSNLGSYFLIALLVFFVFFLLRVLLRRDWIAAPVCVILFSVTFTLANEDPVTGWLIGVIWFTMAVIILLRIGLLTLVVAIGLSSLLFLPLTLDFNSWCAGNSLVILLVVAGVALYGFYFSLGGRPLLREEFLEA